MGVYLTGDTHGDFDRIIKFSEKMDLSSNDIIIILGDAGFNYYSDIRDSIKKNHVSEGTPASIFCVHGNHEKRPFDIDSYRTKEYNGGSVWYEDDYPNILFAKDGDIYSFEHYKCIVIGGAYSVDKWYRLEHGWNWFANEQPSDDIKAYVERQLTQKNNKIDIVLSHTCPLKYEPTEVFLSSIDQNSVDKSTEEWLDTIEDKIDYKRWFCGHYHTDKDIDRLSFMYKQWHQLM